MVLDPDTAPLPAPLRGPTGRRRPYPADVVAGVRALLVGTGLSYRKIAARTGLREDCVGRWARRFGWRRAGSACGAGVEDLTGRWPSPLWGGPSRSGASTGVGVAPDRAPAVPSAPPPPRLGLPAESVPPRKGEGSAPRPFRHGPEVREAARVLIEGTRLGLERIGLEIGVSRGTLVRWRKRFGWPRPNPPDRPGPHFYRSRRFGRPYGGDAVGTARDLVMGSKLPIRRVAARAGVTRGTVHRWMKQGGWTRQPWVAAAQGRYHPVYDPAVVAAARELYCTTNLPLAFIAARTKATTERVGHWARNKGWTRPRDDLDPDGRIRRRRARARRR